MRMVVRKRVKVGFIEKQKSKIRASEKRAEGELTEKLTELCELWNAKSCLIVLPLPSKGEDGDSKFTVKKMVRKMVNYQNFKGKDQMMKLYEKIIREKSESSSSSSPSFTSPSVFVEPDDTPMVYDHQMQYRNLYDYYNQIPQILEKHCMEANRDLKPKEPVHQFDCQPLYDFYDKLPQMLHEFNLRYNLYPNTTEHEPVMLTDRVSSSNSTTVTDDDHDDDGDDDDDDDDGDDDGDDDDCPLLRHQ